MRCRPLVLLCVVAVPVHAQDGPAVPRGLATGLPGATAVGATSAAAALGRKLFFDPRLSRDGKVSCASCHDPALAFTDGRAVSTGVDGRLGARNSPTVINRGYGRLQFWDGRVGSLLEQVMHPIEDPAEMDVPRADAVAKITKIKDYKKEFSSALNEDITEASLARAIASYVATILSGDAPFDRFIAGDTLALSTAARIGRDIFFGKGNCQICHRGPNFTDEAFHNTGIAWRDGAPVDSGRYTVTRQPGHVGAFKTPTLREVARTAPYMHDGSLATLEDVVEFYDRGGIQNALIPRSILRPLSLTPEEKGGLVAFLHALSGTIREGGW